MHYHRVAVGRLLVIGQNTKCNEGEQCSEHNNSSAARPAGKAPLAPIPKHSGTNQAIATPDAVAAASSPLSDPPAATPPIGSSSEQSSRWCPTISSLGARAIDTCTYSAITYPIAVHDPDDGSACSHCDHDLQKRGHESGQQQQHSHAAAPRHHDPTSTDNSNNTQTLAIRETTIFTDGDSFKQSIKGSVPGFVLPSIDHQLQRHCCQERHISEVCEAGTPTKSFVTTARVAINHYISKPPATATHT
ncbi:unnamed protein product [Phytophthora fragariaefolia]|uniref:Unnamed protein product n=1 Tax=Phytophthora fragariaefolia TaxID=1490495 RepID=A0A9W6XMD2_9STRA|nr:unnamed protein product [Phytophthora fragariaefolia]